MEISGIRLSYNQPQAYSVKKVSSCEGFNFQQCIRCPFWKHGKCQKGKDKRTKG